jgi:serine protease Do
VSKKGTILMLAALFLGVCSAEASSLSEVYKRVRSSVVVIQTEQKEVDPVQGVNLVDAAGLGSGVLISKDGQIMTAAHVVQAANKIAVTFMSGETIPARVIASEPSADLAADPDRAAPLHGAGSGAGRLGSGRGRRPDLRRGCALRHQP